MTGDLSDWPPDDADEAREVGMAADSPPRLGPPPLRIHHLLVATAVSAGFLAVAHALAEDGDEGFGSFFRSGFGVVHCLQVSIAVTTFGYLLAWRAQGRLRLDQPGHWLLIHGVLNVGVYVLGVAMILSPNGDFVFFVYSVYSISLLAVNLAVYAYAAWKVADTRGWRLFFVAEVAIGLFFAVVTFAAIDPEGSWITSLVTPTMLLLLAAAVIGDRRSKRRRDWPHWVGVGSMVVSFVSYFAMQLLRWMGIS